MLCMQYSLIISGIVTRKDSHETQRSYSASEDHQTGVSHCENRSNEESFITELRYNDDGQ